MLKITVFPRIHISLIGMSNEGYRLNGGIGFSIISPTLDTCFEISDSIDVIDKREHGFTQEELDRLKNRINNVVVKKKFESGIRCIIHNSMIQSHVGFGSNTMIYLSCIEALFILNHRSYSDNDIIVMSGRGGTSGIGINTYFKGGFVFDTGVINQGQRPLAPSSSFGAEMEHKPLLMKSMALPEWHLGICVPVIKHKTEEEEKEFFKKNCPIAREDTENILYESVFGITSSLMENDFNVFCKSIDAIQRSKWKSLERSLYGKELKDAESIIKKAGARCVGMSSLGPMLYFFADDIDIVVKKVKQNMPQCFCIKTSFNNSKRIVVDD